MKIGIIGAGAIGYHLASAYCTELHMEELAKVLQKANKESAATHRDEMVYHLVNAEVPLTHEQVVALNRMVYE